MRISNEIDRINYLPSSRFFDYLQVMRIEEEMDI